MLRHLQIANYWMAVAAFAAILAVHRPLLAQSSPRDRQVQPSGSLTDEEQQTLAAQRDDLWHDAHQLEFVRNYDEAVAKLEAMLPLERQLHGDDQPQVADDLAYLADLQLERSDFAEARKARSEVLRIRTKLLSKDHWQVVDARLLLEDCDKLAGMNDSERSQWHDADQLLERTKNLQGTDQQAKGAELAHRAAEAFAAIAGEQHRLTAAALVLEAQIDESLGRADKALAPLKRAVEINIKSLGLAHPSSADGLLLLGHWYFEHNDSASAIPVLQQALEANEKLYGEENSTTLLCMNDLGVANFKVKNFPEAVKLHRRALEIRRRTLGEDHPHTQLSLNSLAATYAASGDDVSAVPLYEQALKYRESKPEPDETATTQIVYNLAHGYFQQHRLQESLTM